MMAPKLEDESLMFKLFTHATATGGFAQGSSAHLEIFLCLIGTACSLMSLGIGCFGWTRSQGKSQNR